MINRFKYILDQLGERLWVKPLAMTIVAIAVVFVARIADQAGVQDFVPDISTQSINTLLSVMSASMLVIATFSVASMVSAYASASAVATPRAFPLIISDDVSQNALSSFIGAFIFSVVGLTAIENSYFDKAGRFTLFCLTILFFTIVILTFVRWVDKIARLGRLEETISRVEAATAEALERRRREPFLRGTGSNGDLAGGEQVFAVKVGYVQHIEMKTLQRIAESNNVKIAINALPGSFVAHDFPVATVRGVPNGAPVEFARDVAEAFYVGVRRSYTNDPQFGLIVLSEIASRALSPAVNDPGTAVDVIGRFVRLLSDWAKPVDDDNPAIVGFDRVAVPALDAKSLFQDAFNAVARDGSGMVEVAVKVQNALRALASIDDEDVREAAITQSKNALGRSLTSLTFPADIEAIKKAAAEVGRLDA